MIPSFNHCRKHKPYIYDGNLKIKCNNSKNARRRWKASGGCRSGTAFDAIWQAEKDVKEYVKLCKAQREEKDPETGSTVKNRDLARFHIFRQKVTCRKLVVDGNAASEGDLLYCWKMHISDLAKSKLNANRAERRVESNLHARSFDYNDLVL